MTKARPVKLINRRAGIWSRFILTPKFTFFSLFFTASIFAESQSKEKEAKKDLKGRVVKRDQRGPSRKGKQHEQMPLEVKLNKHY